MDKTSNDSRKKGLILSFSGILLMSFDAPLIRLASVSSWNVAFYRGFFIFLILGSLFFYKNKGRSYKILINGGFPQFFSGMLWGVSGFFFVLGVKMTVAANALVFLSISPVIAALLSLFLLKEAIPLRTWVSIFITITGVVIIVTGDLGTGNLAGNIFALLAPFCLALNLTYMRKHTDINRTASVFIGGIITALISLPLASPFTVPFRGMVYLALLGLVVIPFSQLLLSIGTKYLPSPEVSLIMVNETWLGSLWIWIFIHERPSANTFIGGALILFTIVINSAFSIREEYLRQN